jgi:hypothetical protein
MIREALEMLGDKVVFRPSHKASVTGGGGKVKEVTG